MRKEYTFHSKEEKLELVKRYLSGESPKRLSEETGISDGNIRKWKREYLAGGEQVLGNKKKTGNPLSKYERRKNLSREELQTGCKVSDISVWQSMKRLHIRGYTRKKKPIPTQGMEHHIHPNILNREFYCNIPRQKVATDITYIKHKGKWYYFSCFLDLYNNEILEWELSDTCDNKLVIEPARRLFRKTNTYRTPYPFAQRSGRPIRISRLLNLTKRIRCFAEHVKSWNSER